MAVHEKIGMPLDEFIELGNEHPFELINGERIPRLPNVGGHSYYIRLLSRLLSAYSNIGECFTETTYILPDRYDSNWVTGSRIPDVLFISIERWIAYVTANPNWMGMPFAIVPDLVIEVISPTDKFIEVNKKVDSLLSDGVSLVVVVDPQNRKVFVYDANLEQPLFLSGEDVLDFNKVVPGFQIALPKLFENPTASTLTNA